MGWVGEKADGGDCQCMLHGEICRISDSVQVGKRV
jgi:hypothetical protein